MKKYYKYNNEKVDMRLLRRRCGDGRYGISQWIKFCYIMLNEGFGVNLYEARETYSKYITVIDYRGNQSFKVRFSNHKPIKARELNNDCDYFVGVTHTGVRDIHGAIHELLQSFGKLNRRNVYTMVKEAEDKMQEEGFGGTFGSVATPSGGALVHNRVQKTERKLEVTPKTDKRDQRS